MKLLRQLLLTFTITFTSYISYSAGMGMGMGPPCGGVFPPCPVPVDGFISILLGGGAILAYKKLKQHK